MQEADMFEHYSTTGRDQNYTTSFINATYVNLKAESTVICASSKLMIGCFTPKAADETY